MSPGKQQHRCYQEARIATLEANMENKTEDITGVNKDYYHLRDKIDMITMNVTELTTLIRENHKRREEADIKIEILQKEVAELNSNVDQFNHSISNFKWIIGVGVPVVCTVLTFAIEYLF